MPTGSRVPDGSLEGRPRAEATSAEPPVASSAVHARPRRGDPALGQRHRSLRLRRTQRSASWGSKLGGPGTRVSTMRNRGARRADAWPRAPEEPHAGRHGTRRHRCRRRWQGEKRRGPREGVGEATIGGAEGSAVPPSGGRVGACRSGRDFEVGDLEAQGPYDLPAWERTFELSVPRGCRGPHGVPPWRQGLPGSGRARARTPASPS